MNRCAPYLTFESCNEAHSLTDSRIEGGDDRFELYFYIYVAPRAGPDVVRRHADVRSPVFFL